MASQDLLQKYRGAIAQEVLIGVSSAIDIFLIADCHLWFE
jgi:hypothetical protein